MGAMVSLPHLSGADRLSRVNAYGLVAFKLRFAAMPAKVLDEPCSSRTSSGNRTHLYATCGITGTLAGFDCKRSNNEG